MLNNIPSKPAGRSGQAMAYDSARQAVVMMGGTSLDFNRNWVYHGDTWELIALDKPIINEQPATQYRAAGETAVFTVSAIGPGGQLAFKWKKNGVSLSNSARVTGVVDATLRLSGVTADDAGQYVVEVSSPCGTTASLPATLTLDPSLQIFSANQTLTLVWSDPGVVLEQADAPWRPVERGSRRGQSIPSGIGRSLKVLPLAQLDPMKCHGVAIDTVAVGCYPFGILSNLRIQHTGVICHLCPP